ncbi:MAG: 30S ribosomal protein S17e [Candidatus Nezhaarchaeota archaeon]|nr:30S ribosomal protein S17e [Candidatus Nezhaarchaeota archaeon]
MGKIRPSSVKRLALHIFRQNPDRVSLDYASNKKLVLEISTVRAKHLLNRVAGYLTRLAKRYKGLKTEAKAEPEQEIEEQEMEEAEAGVKAEAKQEAQG